MTTHVMIDLETLGTKAGCVIRSVGAVLFDPRTGELGREFYAVVDRASCEAIGLTVDPETEAWWARQSEEARAALEIDPRPVDQVIHEFTIWWREATEGGGRTFMWAHAPNFDEVILDAVYRAVGIKPPWKYWDARCTRTAYDLAGGVTPDRAQGVHHNALDDAKAQARAVAVAYGKLGLAA